MKSLKPLQRFKIIFVPTLAGAALLAASGMAMAAYDGSRDSRMDSALDDYHNSKAYRDSRNESPGPAARTENSIKRGAHNTGHAIKHGAERVGHAVGTGLHKTGEAIDHAGEKLKGKTADQ